MSLLVFISKINVSARSGKSIFKLRTWIPNLYHHYLLGSPDTEYLERLLPLSIDSILSIDDTALIVDSDKKVWFPLTYIQKFGSLSITVRNFMKG